MKAGPGKGSEAAAVHSVDVHLGVLEEEAHYLEVAQRAGHEKGRAEEDVLLNVNLLPGILEKGANLVNLTIEHRKPEIIAGF